jgi:hypothetical protein
MIYQRLAKVFLIRSWIATVWPVAARCRSEWLRVDGVPMSMLGPPENKTDAALARDFMGHLVTGGGLFLLAGAVSMLIELATSFAGRCSYRPQRIGPELA